MARHAPDRQAFVGHYGLYHPTIDKRMSESQSRTVKHGERHQVCRAVVLQHRRIADIHKGLTILTDRRGLLYPIAYGGYSPRGRLRGITNLFCYGDCWLYSDRRSIKLSDFEVLDWFNEITSNIEKFCVATLWAEVAIATHGGGDTPQITFPLFVEALRSLNHCSHNQNSLVSAQFLLRYIAANGTPLQFDRCIACGRKLTNDEARLYDGPHSGICCPACATSQTDHLLPETAQLGQHLSTTETVSTVEQQDQQSVAEAPVERTIMPKQPIAPSSAAVQQLLAIIYRHLQNLLGRSLNSIRIGQQMLSG